MSKGKAFVLIVCLVNSGYILRMPTYVYETVSTKKGTPPESFEVRQSMTDPPLRKHPKTGEPVRRVISGGFGVLTRGSSPSSAPPSGGCCGGHCGGHRH